MAQQVSIKFSFSDDVRRIKVSPQITYPEVLVLLKSLFKLPEQEWENLNLKYTDNEGDKCTVTGEQELREAFHAKKEDVLKLELTFNTPKRVELHQSPFVNAIRRRIQQEQALQQQPDRRCGNWAERAHCRRSMIFGLTEEGIALMDAHKYNEAKEIFAKQAEMFQSNWKKSVPLYNIACCEALLGNTDSALAYLAKAINCGYKNVQHMDQDKDLDSLRGLDAFEVMMGEIRNAPQTERKKECRWKGRFQNMNCHQQRDGDNVTSPLVEKIEEKVEEPKVEQTCPVFSAVTGEVVGEVKSSVEAKTPTEEVVKAEPVQFEAELKSLFQMGFTNERKNKNVLRKTNGNLSEAVVLLLR